MQRLNIVCWAVLAAFCVLGSPVSAAAPADGSDPRWDAVAAGPDNHKVVFENDRVRVLQVHALMNIGAETCTALRIGIKPQPSAP